MYKYDITQKALMIFILCCILFSAIAFFCYQRPNIKEWQIVRKSYASSGSGYILTFNVLGVDTVSGKIYSDLEFSVNPETYQKYSLGELVPDSLLQW